MRRQIKTTFSIPCQSLIICINQIYQMKTSTQLIRAELLSTYNNFPILTTCKIARTFLNKDLVYFVNKLLEESNDFFENELILLRLKKIILQTPREMDQKLVGAEPDNYYQFI